MREYFPIFRKNPGLIYLDSAATSHKPQSVVDALANFYADEYATVHRAIYKPSLLATDRYNATREAAARFIHASRADEVIFTRGTTDGINLVAQSYGKTFLKEGDEILISQMEHHSNIVPWQMLAEQTGAKLRWIFMDDSGVLQWKNRITPNTKIVSIAHVSNVTGTVNPIREIAKAAHQVGAVILVDGAQAAAHMEINVEELGCDFYIFSGHKCYGPTGVGVLWGKRELLLQMPPIQGGGDMIEQVELEGSTYQLPPLRFEAGTPLIGSVIALKNAFDFIEMIGRSKIAAHEQLLLEVATERLRKIPRLRILGLAPNKGPILTFNVDGVHPLDLASFLDLKQIAIRSGHLCAQPVLHAFGFTVAARASFGIYNTLDEVEIFAKTLEDAIGKLTTPV